MPPFLNKALRKAAAIKAPGAMPKGRAIEKKHEERITPAAAARIRKQAARILG